MVRMQSLPNPQASGKCQVIGWGVHMGWSAPPQLLRLSPTLTLSLYDYALSTAFLNIRLTHDAVSRTDLVLCSVVSFRPIAQKSALRAGTCDAPGVALVMSERLRKYFQKVGRNAFVLHS